MRENKWSGRQGEESFADLQSFSMVKRLQWVTNGKTRDTAKDEGTRGVKSSEEERNSLEISDIHCRLPEDEGAVMDN